MLQFNAVGLFALLATVMCWSLAVLLYRVGTSGSVARYLSLLLLIEGVILISTGYIDLFLGPAIRAQVGYSTWLSFEEIVHTFGDCAMLALYPYFLAGALKTSLTRPFAARSTRLVLAVAAAALFVAVLWGPMKIAATLLYLLLVALFGFALVASLHAWKVADGTTRARARVFALAFGLRDACWILAYGWATWALWSGTYLVVDPDASGWPYIVYALGTFGAVPLIAYGILKTQLFDIDLRIQWTLRQSTLAGIIVTIIFVVSEGADRLLSEEFGSWAGLLAAAVIVYFLSPLQRFAESVAEAAMPNTRNTPEYAAFRKMQVYEAAVSEAQLEGGISAKERALLVRLRDSLGISASDADSIEAELRANPRGQ